MRIILLLFISIIVTARAHTQVLPLPVDTLDPSVVILAPTTTKVDPQLDASVRAANEKAHAMLNILVEQIDKGLAEKEYEKLSAYLDSSSINERVAQATEQAGVYRTYASKYQRSLLGSQISVSMWMYVTYYLHGTFVDPVVKLSADSSSLDRDYLAAVAKRYGVRYVISFPTVRIGADQKEVFAKVRGVLFDSRADKFLIDTMITGDENSHGEPFACREKLPCTIINCGAHFCEIMSRAMTATTPKIAFANELWKLRSQALRERHCIHPCSQAILARIPHDPIVPATAGAITCFANSDTTKIVALMALMTSRSSWIPMSNGRYPTDTTGIRGDDDPNPDTSIFSFILHGALVDGKWYFAKSHVAFGRTEIAESRLSLIDALQLYGFFEENDTVPSMRFWESGLFERVTDPRTSPRFDPDRYSDQQALKQFEEYGGMYRFVAEQLQRERAERKESDQK